MAVPSTTPAHAACWVARLCTGCCRVCPSETCHLTHILTILLQGRMPGDLIRALRATFLHNPQAAHQPRLQPHDFDWAGVGAAVSGLHRTVPGVSCLLGPLEAEVRGWSPGHRRALLHGGDQPASSRRAASLSMVTALACMHNMLLLRLLCWPPQAKARKVVVRRARQAVDELTRPQEVQAIQASSEAQLDQLALPCCAGCVRLQLCGPRHRPALLVNRVHASGQAAQAPG